MHPAMDDDDLESSWRELRSKSGTMPKVDLHPWDGPPMGVFQAWLEDIEQGRALLTLNGPSRDARAKSLNALTTDSVVVAGVKEGDDWVRCDIDTAVLRRLSAFTPQTWDWVHETLLAPTFMMEDALKSIVDQDSMLITSLYRALWEVRFLLQEGQDAQPLFRTILRWMGGASLSEEDHRLLSDAGIDRETHSTQERLDLTFFLMTMAHQNGVFDRAVLVFDGLETGIRLAQDRRKKLLHELPELIATAHRWSRLNSGVGLVLGLNANESVMAALRSYKPALAKQIEASLV